MAPSPPRRAAGYVRVSQIGARGGDSFLSPELQRERIEAWAAYRQAEVVEWYTDLDVSGREGVRRPEFERLMRDAAQGRFDVVAVYRLTRFGRSVKDTATRYAELQAAGVGLVSVSEEIDTTSAGGKFLQHVLFAMAEFESERIGEEWRAVHANRRRRGLAQVPRSRIFGYRVEPKTAVIADVDEAEAPAVRELFQRRARGASLTELQRYLRSAGYRPVRGGEKFSISTIGDMLRNPLYAGLVRSDGELIAAQHAALVERDTWDAVQALWQRSVSQNRHRGGLCSGIVVCAECGAKMVAWYSNANKRPMYRCPAATLSRDCSTKPTIDRASLDQYVEQAFLRHVDPARMPNRGWARRRRGKPTLDLAKQLRETERRIDQVVQDRYRVGVADDVFDREIRRLSEERDGLSADLAEAKAASDRAARPIHFSTGYPRLSVDRRREMLRVAIAAVRVSPGRRGGPAMKVEERVAIDWL